MQFAADGEREKKLAADAEAALARLAAEEDTLRKEAAESAGRRSGVDAKVAAADGELNAAEKIFSDLTTALADLTAQRHAHENAAREQGERVARITAEIAEIERELATLSADHAPLAAAVEGAQAALTEAEAAAVAAEAAHNNARADVEAARAAFGESEKRVQRLETEAKTLGQMLSLETRNLWPPVIDHVSVDKGFEKALGAALGDDLDAPVDASAPMHWSKAPIDRERSGFAGKAPSRWRASSRRRNSSPAGWRRSAWSTARPAPGSPPRSRPASGWSRAKAICGAGTVMSRRPTPRPAPRGAWRSAAASPRSTPNW